MRVLVTGGAGFLGSHLCDWLLGTGDEVICLDNLFTGSRRNIDRLLEDHRFEFVRGDVCEPFHFEVDRIYHLACPASPVHYQRNPARTIETAVLGTRNALDLARSTGARLLIASTSEIYGDPLQHPQTENYWGNANTIGPRSNYDEGKRCGEALAAAWAAQYNVQVRLARIFNTYGPRMAVNDGRVVSNFLVQAITGSPMTVYGDGSQTRSFCYVADLIQGLTSLMKFEDQAPGTVLPINLGNPAEFTMMELAREVQKLLPRASIEYKPLPKDDPARRRPDISRAKSYLRWEPTVPLADGLQRTLEYFQALLT